MIPQWRLPLYGHHSESIEDLQENMVAALKLSITVSKTRKDIGVRVFWWEGTTSQETQ